MMSHQQKQQQPPSFAYVCFTRNDHYITLLNTLIKSIENFSQHHFYIYTILEDNNTSYENNFIIKSKLFNRVTIIPFPKHKDCISMFNYKAKILSHFIANNNNYFTNTACYLDIDCLITPLCDNIFDLKHLINNTPISAMHPDNVTNSTLSSLQDFFKIPTRTIPFLHNDLILFNKNCLSFMEEWDKACITANHITIWDEYTYNTTLWKFNDPKQYYLINPIDLYYQEFYSNIPSRLTNYIYHGCKDPQTVQLLLNDMNNYYLHPLSLYNPYPYFHKIRLGRNNDGGYIIAVNNSNNNLLPNYDLFLSAGIADDVSFEIEFTNKFNIQCYTFDSSVDSLPKEAQSNHLLRFNKTNISNITSNQTNSTNLHNFFDSPCYHNIFLKMDIEGAEELFFSSLTPSHLQKLLQIVIEVHSPDSYIPTLLQKTHYLIHIHANNYGGVSVVDGVPIPSVYELTYLRKDCFPQIPLLNIDNLPTPLDQKNGLYRPDGSDRPEIILHCKPYINKPIIQPFIINSYCSFFV